MKAKIESGFEIFELTVFIIAHIAVLVGKALKKSAEFLFLCVIGFIDRAEDVFVSIYPVAGPLVFVLLICGAARYSDVNSSPIQDFMICLYKMIIAFVILTLLYKFLKERKKRSR